MCMCIVHVQCTTPCTVPCALPHGSQVDVIEVVWPDGACAVLSASVTIDTLHTVAYPTGSGDSTAACSNVTSANGGTRLSPLEMHLCMQSVHNARTYTSLTPMARLTLASSARRHSSRRERRDVCGCESGWPALALAAALAVVTVPPASAAAAARDPHFGGERQRERLCRHLLHPE